MKYHSLSLGMSWEQLSLLAGEVLFSVYWEVACSASPLQTLLAKGLHSMNKTYYVHIIRKIEVVNNLPYVSVLVSHIQ